MSNSMAETDNNVAQMGTASDESGAAAPEKMKSLAASNEMRIFYKTLARVQAAAIYHVMLGQDADGMKANAVEVATRLNNEAVSLLRLGKTAKAIEESLITRGSPKCPAGTEWDETLQACV